MLRVTESSYAVAELPQPVVNCEGAKSRQVARRQGGPAFNMALHVAVKPSSVFELWSLSAVTVCQGSHPRPLQWTSPGRSHTDALDYLG